MIEQLRNILPDTRLSVDEPMSAHTSFRIGGPAAVYARPSNIDELTRVLAACRENKAVCTLLGGGSNVLVADTGLPGVTIQTRPGLRRCELLNKNRITAETGVTLRELSEIACRAGLSGLAFASGIPGTVGGAVYMNAGAFEHSIAEVLETAEVLMPDGQIITFDTDACVFGYRQSIFQKNGGIVLSSTFRLFEGDSATIRSESDALNERRAQTQPLDLPSAGSTFKRPPGHFAGKLISDAGLRGYTVGGAAVSEKHAGFIVNIGGATAADVRALIGHVRHTVHEQFNVWLEPEIRMLGF